MKKNSNSSLFNGSSTKKEDNVLRGLIRSFSQGSLGSSCGTNFSSDEIDSALSKHDDKLEKLESIISPLLAQNDKQRIQLANQQDEINVLKEALKNAVKTIIDFKDTTSAKMQADAAAQQSVIEQRALTIQADLKRSVTSLKQEQQKDKQEISFLYGKELPSFLNLVAWGEEEKVEQILKNARRLATMSGDLTDPAGREFKNITAFQYAVWALDYHMWTMIRNYLTDEQIRAQLAGLNNGSWVTEYGNQVSWQNLIDALQIHATIGHCAAQDITKHWCTQVGGEQLKLPAHVINEYMRLDQSFNPCPDFTATTLLPRSNVHEWYQPLHNRPRGVGKATLGVDAAWSRDGQPECRSSNWADLYCSSNVVAVRPAVGDAAALNKLLQVRLKQSSELRLQTDKMPAPKPKP